MSAWPEARAARSVTQLAERGLGDVDVDVDTTRSPTRRHLMLWFFERAARAGPIPHDQSGRSTRDLGSV